MTQPLNFYAFWSINAPIERDELFAQLNAFRAAGLNGVVWHPRRYPVEPVYLGSQYMALLSEVILEARSLGLAFWIYDENGWPSGTVDGEMLARHPDLTQQWAGLYQERPDDALAEFEHGGARWFVGRKRGAGVDYLNPALAPRFLELTHERYRTQLAPDAWAHVETFFCDEPELGLGHAYDALPKDGAIPWTADLAEAFAERHGEPLLPQIGKLFFSSEDSAELRVKFWELLRDRFAHGFLRPIDVWCRSHGKKFTAHIKGEEHPLFQVPMVGSCSAVYRELSLPGVDALERFPANGFYPRQAVTSARQFGHGRSMAEAFGGAGWGASPEDMERYLLWLARSGVTDFVMHLSQYCLDSAAICDWPPSQPLHLNWREAYPHVLARVRAALVKNPSQMADTLVITPHRAIMEAYEPRELGEMNIHNAAIFADTAAGEINRRFLKQVGALHAAGEVCDFVDEATYEEHAVKIARGVRVGKSEYACVIVAEGARLRGGPMVAPSIRRAAAVTVAGERECPAFVTSEALRWRSRGIRLNSFLLENDADSKTARFVCEESVTTARKPELRLRFVDEVESCRCNGRTLTLEHDGRGVVALLPRSALSPANTVEFSWRVLVSAPMVWLEGDFAVESESCYEVGPSGTVRTRGPFVIRDQTETVRREQVAAGFPFTRASLVAETDVVLLAEARTLRFDDALADAMRVWLGETDLGWTWGPHWAVAIPGEMPAGTHVLRVELVPSTFNYFGPHRYVGGDWHVVSPDQFSGRKNFADPADAPEHTLGKEWHFKPHRLPVTVSFSRTISDL